MDAVDIVGIAAGTMGSVMLLPQLRLMYYETTEGTSLSWLFLSMTTTTLWMSYGVLADSMVIILVNIVSAFIHTLMIVLALYRKDCATVHTSII